MRTTRTLRPFDVALLASVMGLSACVSAPAPAPIGRVGHTDITASIASADQRLTLASNESFLMPLEDLGNAVPIYPADLLADALPPRTVCLQVDIDESGKVSAATPADDVDPCPTGTEPAFVEAARSAVLTWRFDPALRCVFPDAATRELAIASCAGGEEHPQAIRIAYRFVFESLDGRGVVRMGK